MSNGCALTTSRFLDDDKDRDDAAYSQIFSIPKISLGSEFHVLRILLVHLTLIAGHLVLLPLWAIKAITSGTLLSTPESCHSFAILLSSVLTIFLILVAGINLNFSYDLISTQKYYKLWAAYTLSKVIIRFCVRMHSFTHRMLRGAIRSSGIVALVIGAAVHSVSTFIYFVIYTIVNGCYLAGLLGKQGLFFSAVLHIQAVIAKKYFPKPTEGPPSVDEPINRTVLIVAVVYHMAKRPFETVSLMVKFEFASAIVRFFMTALTEDGGKLYEIMSQGSNNAVWSFQNSEARFENSLIASYPFEVFALLFLNLVFAGSVLYGVTIAGGIVAVALAGPIVIQLLPATAPVAEAPKLKKEKTKGVVAEIAKEEPKDEPKGDPPQEKPKTE
jgi:hypothetical protein